MESHLKAHRKFKLNGICYRNDELREVAYSLIKEGEPYERSIGDFLMHWLDDSPILEVKTSGSTGKPKSLMLQKKHMVNSAYATGRFFDLKPGDSAFLCLPADFIAGKMMLVRAMVLGLDLDFGQPVSKPKFRRQYYNFCAMVPLQVEHSLGDLDHVHTLIVGGAPLSEELKSRICKTGGTTKVFETYGMTETITHVAVRRVVPKTVSEPYFKALPRVRFSVDDRNCLVVEAPGISSQHVYTNDLVKLISDTEFMWLGRFDNVVNSGGIKLYPETIEKKLASIIGSRFFVAGIPDKDLGEKLILVHEGEVDGDELLKAIKAEKSLDTFEVPKAVYGLPKFRETKNGKIKRTEMLKMIAPQ